LNSVLKTNIGFIKSFCLNYCFFEIVMESKFHQEAQKSLYLAIQFSKSDLLRGRQF